MSDKNPNEKAALDFFKELESLAMPPMPQAVRDAGLDADSASMLWMAMLTSYAMRQDDPRQAIQDDKHSAFEYTSVTDEPCEVCGTRHGMMVFSVYTKTPEELERLKTALHREMAQIQAERGERLSS